MTTGYVKWFNDNKGYGFIEQKDVRLEQQQFREGEPHEPPAGELLRTLDEQGVPLVFTGHKHQPWAWRINDTVISTTGTFCSKKTNCGQSFNFIQLDNNLTIQNVDVQTGEARVLGEWNLPTLP